jgi:hypothetical protein
MCKKYTIIDWIDQENGFSMGKYFISQREALLHGY